MTKKHTDILKRAIHELPEMKAPERVNWESLRRELAKNKWSVLVSKLPKFKAPGKAWPEIKARLDEQQEPETLHQKLPQYLAPEGLWDNIEKQLPSTGRTKSLRMQTWWQLAASVVLLIGLAFIISRSDRVQLALNPESSAAERLTIDNLINPSLCAHNPQVCSKPVYKELNIQLEEVSSELEKMETLLDQHNDPQMLKYYYRLQNEQAEIQKQLMKLILET